MTEGASTSTSVHRGPARRDGAPCRPVLVCVYPRALALAVPDSGSEVGRAWLAERDLPDREVSSAHLRWHRAGGAVCVVDLDSRNGTWIDGTRIDTGEKVPLCDGAVLRIGKSLFVFRERLDGPLQAADDIGDLVGPFGLRELGRSVEGLSRAQPTNVLLEGETGVGKELAARALAASLGRAHPFAAVNVAGVAPGVFESHMFGHVAGAFSGAGDAAAGIARAHASGTLFLDEIGELDLVLQAKLLRLLDNREVLPVGADRAEKVDVLVIAATNRNLAEMVHAGRFRRDLFARLAMARLTIPPLRARCEDLFSIATSLWRRAGVDLVAENVEVEALERLVLEPWPSNVRGLDATLAAVGRRDPGQHLRLWALEEELGATDRKVAITQAAIEAAIVAATGNVSAAARALGISRGKLLRQRKKAKGT